MKRTIIDASQFELDDQVVTIKRVTKVVKGGRNMRFAALVVVGDHNGPFPGKIHSDSLADSLTRSGDQHNLSFERVHR